MRKIQAVATTVNSLLNIANNADGVCAIRDTIINANNDSVTWTNCPASTGADVISFSVAETIALASALTNITISGNNLFRL